MSTSTAVASFDLLGELPGGPTTTVLEASAGTGKTYALAGLVTRYLAEGHATLDQMLLITFGRAATQELRDRVRDQLVRAAEALDVIVVPAHAGRGGRGVRSASDEPRDHGEDAPDALITHLLTGTPEELTARRDRLRDALAGFDAATIATTHQFCQIVLRSLGVAGDSDAGLRLVESLDDVVAEVVDDLYLSRFGDDADPPPLTRAEALELAGQVVANPRTRITPADPEPGSVARVRRDFAAAVVTELERRKRRLGVLGFDDLLGRLAESLGEPDAPACERMRRRWSVVMVDEFQDTDPVQWEVLERAFLGHATVVLIGDPKQAIYSFRGGDISTYLRARRSADTLLTLDTNWRSDRPLVDRLQVLLRGATLGHDDIAVRGVDTHHVEHRLAGAGDRGDPLRLRLVDRAAVEMPKVRTIPMDALRSWIATDLAADVKDLLAGGATYDGRPLRAGDLAVIVAKHKDARACHEALARAGVPAVYTGDTDVFASPAAEDWLCLLEACEQPHRAAMVRAAACTRFFGHTAVDLATRGDVLTEEVGQVLRRWTDHLRERGVAAVMESALAGGMAERVLRHQGGERHMTDLEHVGQLLHETAHRERLGPTALLDWLRQQTRERVGATERNRRLDSDAAAVQIMTVWVSKGLQYPVVYLPFAFNRNVQSRDVVLHHDGDQRCLDIGGKRQPGYRDVEALGHREEAGDDLRQTYVALTRAQSQVVAWWAPSYDEPNGGLSRLLRGRTRGEAAVPERAQGPVPTDADAVALFRAWESEGGLALERALHVTPAEPAAEPAPTGLDVRRFARTVDLAWQRTSYSGLIRDVDDQPGPRSEPETTGTDDETEPVVEPSASLGPDPADPRTVVSPMAELPAGAGFGSLVHAVLEAADPQADDLAAELATHVTDQLTVWPVEAGVDDLVAALLPLYDSPLGPLAGGATLRDVGRADRLCELDFEIPLTGGDRARGRGRAASLADVGRLLRTHLSDDDPLRPYAERLVDGPLGLRPLRGYLSGSIDVILRVPSRETTEGTEGTGGVGGGEPRFLVVDYKTNRLAGPGEVPTAADFTQARLTEAMLHSDYPLQALLYTVVAHRYLRWRQPGYDPARHLGGVLYLYVRGMCGPDTPVVDGHPTGVFSWLPPVPLVLALSDLLDQGAP